MSLGINLAEAGRIPDWLLRLAIKARHREVLHQEDPVQVEPSQEAIRLFLKQMAKAPIAPAPLDSNRQHYEVPAGLFQKMLGPRLKYSCCIWPADELGNKPGASEAELEFRLLDLAEEEMLKLYAKRADMKDGMNILELGCGWGSFCLWAAENYPESRIWAVSNSTGQGEFIRQKAKEKDLLNLTVLTEDMNEFSPPKEAGAFDRIVSIEMFEHMRNWQALLKRISNWLAPEGLFFLHIFVHRDLAYLFQEGPDQWMARHFFTGGMMPSANLLLYLQKDLEILDHWLVSGLHYARTLESWLALLDANQKACREVLRNDPNPESAKTLFNRWRIFLIACSELFGFDSGNQWLVAHYLMKNRRP